MADINLHNFAMCYMEKCKQKKTKPLPVICVSVPYSLTIPLDRIKLSDWEPIRNSLSLDRTLKSISISSRYPYRKQSEEINSKKNSRTNAKVPPMFTTDVLNGLFHSLSQCLRHSTTLMSLELQGIPIPRECLVTLGSGLSATRSLLNLSFQKCNFGDSGCDVICHSILFVRSIQTLNLSQCDLTSKSGSSIAAVLLQQKLLLFHDAWKESLRYRDPNLDSMQGIRRVTLNGNKRFGDDGVRKIFDAIRDSLWIKALDLQDCGLTDGLCKEIFDALDNNSSLVILSVEMNPNLADDNIREILKKLDKNRANSKSEFIWHNFSENTISTEKSCPSLNIVKKSKKDQMNKALTRSKTFVPRTISEPMAKNQSNIRNREVHFSRSYQPLNRAKTKASMIPPNWRQRPNVEKSRKTDSPQQRHALKASLHLDLQAQIRSVADSTQKDDKCHKESTAMQSSKESLKREEDSSIMRMTIRDTICQLTEITVERERLMEEVKRKDLLLAEERARREMAEENLHTTRYELADLEEVLREKDKETNGYVLVSKQSFDEICGSFDHLLAVLDNTSRQTNTTHVRMDEEISNEDIRRHIAVLLRKTQSENLQRSFGDEYNNNNCSSKRRTIKKITRKSEDDMHSLSPKVPFHMERHIGDSINIGAANIGGDFHQYSLEHGMKHVVSPRTRAREIFARIVNGETTVNLNNRTGYR